MKRTISLVFVLIIAFTAVSAINAQTTVPFKQEGIASWYGTEFDGRLTASNEIFDSSQFTAAHPTLDFGTIATITNTYNNKKVNVRINDRGPFVATRIIDLSMAAAEALDMITTGTAMVTVEANIPAPAAAVQPAELTPGPVQPLTAQPAPAAVQPATVQPSPAPQAAAVLQPEPMPGPVQPAQPEPQTLQPQPAAQLPVQQIPPVQTVPVQPAQPQVIPQVLQPEAAPARSANIIGGMPKTGTGKFYRLQVGAYRVPANALDAFNRLAAMGLSPAYERYNDLYRVVLAKIRPEDIPSIATKIYAAGFPEAVIREER
ncbi:MAG: septal ring lytic transglycosylase RlpA family protein [Treponema sp.]|nr:septal ring lytic transglycosylase RlpA family protein [Treponema sp.]